MNDGICGDIPPGFPLVFAQLCVFSAGAAGTKSTIQNCVVWVGTWLGIGFSRRSIPLLPAFARMLFSRVASEKLYR